VRVDIYKQLNASNNLDGMVNGFTIITSPFNGTKQFDLVLLRSYVIIEIKKYVYVGLHIKQFD